MLFAQMDPLKRGFDTIRYQHSIHVFSLMVVTCYAVSSIGSKSSDAVYVGSRIPQTGLDIFRL